MYEVHEPALLTNPWWVMGTREGPTMRYDTVLRCLKCSALKYREYGSPKPEKGSKISISSVCRTCKIVDGDYIFEEVTKVLGLREAFPWKKYNEINPATGEWWRLGEVIEHDPQYVEWCQNVSKPLRLCASARKALEDRVSRGGSMTPGVGTRPIRHGRY